MKVIIIGKMASGKSSIANYLDEKHGFTVISLAEVIKEMEKQLEWKDTTDLQIVERFFNYLDPMKKAMMVKILEEARKIPREKGKPRLRLQHIGTESRKRLYDAIWIEQASKRAEGIENVVIEDVRFVNEFLYFKRLGYKTILLSVNEDVQRDRIIQLYGKLDPKALTHPSETGVDEILLLGGLDLMLSTNGRTVGQSCEVVEQVLFEHPNS